MRCVRPRRLAARRSCHTAAVTATALGARVPRPGLAAPPGAGDAVAGRISRSARSTSRLGDAVSTSSALLTSAGADELVATENAQLATSRCRSASSTRRGSRPPPPLALGHSLGEYTALVAAGVVSRDDGARLVAARGAAMRDAARATPGGLVAAARRDLEDGRGGLRGHRRASYRREPQRTGPDRRSAATAATLDDARRARQGARLPPGDPPQGRRRVPHPAHGAGGRAL